MDSQSSTGYRNQIGHSGRSSKLKEHTVIRSAHRSQKRWHTKQQRVGSSIQHRRPAAKLNQAEQDNRLRQHALQTAQRGDRLRAIELLSYLIERNPGNASDYNNRGLIYFQDGQLDAAIADYDKALELNPRLDSAYNNRANYYAAQGQFLEAIMDYDTAIDLNPSNIRAWINQGITFRDLELYEQAIESFDLALYLGRFEGHIYAERGRTYHLWGDWNCAIADYQRAVNRLPQPISAFNDPSARLRRQVELWTEELLAPLR